MTDANDMIQVGDTFIDPMEGTEREVMKKGMLMFGKDNHPYWDDSIFTTDGGCVSAEEVFDNLTF